MTLLDPERRSLYVDALRPLPGMIFDRGLATTYSLDLETLLALPLHLVLYAGASAPRGAPTRRYCASLHASHHAPA